MNLCKKRIEKTALVQPLAGMKKHCITNINLKGVANHFLEKKEPVKAQPLNGTVSKSSLNQLPNELSNHVLQWLYPRELLGVVESNKSYYQFIQQLSKQVCITLGVNKGQLTQEKSCLRCYICCDEANHFLLHENFDHVNSVNQKNKFSLDVAMEKNVSKQVLEGLFKLGFNREYIKNKPTVALYLAQQAMCEEAYGVVTDFLEETQEYVIKQVFDVAQELIKQGGCEEAFVISQKIMVKNRGAQLTIVVRLAEEFAKHGEKEYAKILGDLLMKRTNANPYVKHNIALGIYNIARYLAQHGHGKQAVHFGLLLLHTVRLSIVNSNRILFVSNIAEELAIQGQGEHAYILTKTMFKSIVLHHHQYRLSKIIDVMGILLENKQPNVALKLATMMFQEKELEKTGILKKVHGCFSALGQGELLADMNTSEPYK